MDKQQMPESVQTLLLNSDTADKLLNSVYTECDLPPSIVPVEMLEKWGNYRSAGTLLGEVVSIAFLALLLVLPAAFFHPALSARRVDGFSAANAIYEVRTFLASEDIFAAINGRIVIPDKTPDGKYILELAENGTLCITATAFNGQTTTKKYEIENLDTEKPVLADSSVKNGIVRLTVEDAQTGIDYDNISIATADGQDAEIFTIDEAAGIVSFRLSGEPLYVSIPDHAGNTLNIVISPAQAD